MKIPGLERGRNTVYHIPVLLDFGIAKGQAGITPSTSSEHSIAAYSRPYAPIEQLLGMPTTPQSDLFSLGATLYHMLAAQLPVAASQRQDAVNNGTAARARSAPSAPTDTGRKRRRTTGRA